MYLFIHNKKGRHCCQQIVSKAEFFKLKLKLLSLFLYKQLKSIITAGNPKNSWTKHVSNTMARPHTQFLTPI